MTKYIYRCSVPESAVLTPDSTRADVLMTQLREQDLFLYDCKQLDKISHMMLIQSQEAEHSYWIRFMYKKVSQPTQEL